MIEDSVKVDFVNQVTIAWLPFVCDPKDKLVFNRDVVRKVYRQQMKKLARNPEKKAAVIHSEGKLQDAGHVQWVSKLSKAEQELLKEGDGHFLAWRTVDNEGSLSTPTRVVFDASLATKSGYSLNDLLAKGINSMNPMVEIVIRYRTYAVAVHTDIKQMYNVVKLRPEHWKYQRYLWHEELDESEEPVDKAVTTIIYGVVSSGNQAECGLRRTAGAQSEEYPEAAACIINDSYVDDIATGSDETSGAQLCADIAEVLVRGGFVTKGFTISGEPPPAALSKDGIFIKLLGILWDSLNDMLRLAAGGKLNFSKRVRGKKGTGENAWVIPDKLTLRICSGKTAEIYDLIGLIAPILAGFKIDLHELVLSSYTWDDPLSAADREVWLANFALMETLGEGMWPRNTIPKNYVEIEFIGCGDASEKIACAVCYARVLNEDQTYSCHLLLAKSNIVPEGMSLPRAELMACTLNTHVTEIVKKSLKHVSRSVFTYLIQKSHCIG